MSRRNSSDVTYDRGSFILSAIDSPCCETGMESICGQISNGTLTEAGGSRILKEYDESIAEINAMISYFVAMDNKEEISFWRSQLQKTKVEKRRVREMIENMRVRELAFS